eukprot:1339170-Prymnesium_polylepis.1
MLTTLSLSMKTLLERSENARSSQLSSKERLLVADAVVHRLEERDREREQERERAAKKAAAVEKHVAQLDKLEKQLYNCK